MTKTLHQDALIALAAVALLAAPFAARAAAPAGRYIVDTDTVVDTQTHLTWQRAASASSTWNAVTAYCQGLTAGGFSSGWRLPTKKELLSLIDVSTVGSAIDATAFPGTPAGYFWSSSLPGVGRIGAWTVSFLRGDIYFGVATYVRCVR